MSKHESLRVRVLLGSMVLAIGNLTYAAAPQANSLKTNSVKNKIVATDCWQIHSLGTLGGSFSQARDINNSGQVVGDSATAPQVLDPADPPMSLVQPFISAPNGGALTAIVTTGYFGGNATAVNNAGQVVGTTTVGRSFPISFVTDPGGANARNTLAYSTAQDINNVGQTLFDLYYANLSTAIGDNEQPNQVATDLIDVTVPEQDSQEGVVHSVAFNDADQVAVNVTDQGVPTIAYRWSPSEGAVRLVPDADGSTAMAMNNAGQVVGTLMRKGVQQAFVTRWYNTSVIALGKPGDGNTPTGINRFGQIVGTRIIEGHPHGYVTTPLDVRASIDLDTLQEVARDAWSNIEPAAINDRGQIAGTGTLNGEDRAFLLSPLSILAYLPDFNGQHARCFR